MRIPLGFSYLRRSAFAVGIALGGVFGPASVAAQEFPGETATIRQLYPPVSVSKVEVSLLQDALFDEQCYGNLLTHKSEVDQDFGILTKKAMHAFVEAYGRSNVPNKRRFNSWVDVRNEADRKQGVCSSSRAQATVAKLFTNTLTEHDPSKPRARLSQWLELHQNLYPKTGSQIEIAQLQDALFDSRCYGNKLARENEVNKPFGTNSKKALHVFVETYLNQPLRPSRNFANAKEVLQAAQSNQSPCNNQGYLARYFPNPLDHQGDGSSNAPNPEGINKCVLRTASNAWLRSKEEEFRASYKGSTKFEPLNAALERLELALNTYLEAIPPHAPPDAEWLGTKELYTESYVSVLQSISSTVQGKTALAKYGAISQNSSCTKCFLLADFEWLARFAENGALPLFDPQTGRAIADAQTSRQVTVPINSLYFDAIKKSHKRVQEWRVKEEAFLQALRKPTLIGSSFDEQRKKRLEADTAKHEAVLELHRNNELVPANMRQRLDLAVEFANQRNAYCEGDFTIQAKP